MMKYVLLLMSAILLAACNQNTTAVQQLEAKMDSLQKKVDNAYTPGFGELMSSVQVHHSKLWFAGTNQNWPLAAYEQSLISSAFRRIQKYHSDNPNSKALEMITIPMDSIQNAIVQKSLTPFKRSFLLLTTTCNNCHQATKHGFNEIIVPTTNSTDNQDFKASDHTRPFR
jgi:hypothetical protein